MPSGCGIFVSLRQFCVVENCCEMGPHIAGGPHIEGGIHVSHGWISLSLQDPGVSKNRARRLFISGFWDTWSVVAT